MNLRAQLGAIEVLSDFGSIIDGVQAETMHVEHDHRGSLATVWHAQSSTIEELMQWNVVRSHSGVLRGIHTHATYDEFYVPLAGRMFFVLKDARRRSATFGREISFWSDEWPDAAIRVPRGVAHGVFFETAGILAYGLSSGWTGNLEFGCRWDDSEIRSRWPTTGPILSEKDVCAGSFGQMTRDYEAAILKLRPRSTEA